MLYIKLVLPYVLGLPPCEAPLSSTGVNLEQPHLDQQLFHRCRGTDFSFSNGHLNLVPNVLGTNTCLQLRNSTQVRNVLIRCRRKVWQRQPKKYLNVTFAVNSSTQERTCTARQISGKLYFHSTFYFCRIVARRFIMNCEQWGI